MTGIMQDGERRRFDHFGNEIVEDGERVRKPMLLLDSTSKPAPKQIDVASHRSGYGVLTDSQKAAVLSAHRRMVNRVCDAWRDDDVTQAAAAVEAARPASEAKGVALAQAAMAAANAAAADKEYEARKAKMANAWRNATPLPTRMP